MTIADTANGEESLASDSSLVNEPLASEILTAQLDESHYETCPAINLTSRLTTKPAQPQQVALTASGIISHPPKLSIQVSQARTTSSSLSSTTSTDLSPSSPPCPARCLTDLVRRTGDRPFAQGGFSDVWEGELDGEEESSTEKVWRMRKRGRKTRPLTLLSSRSRSKSFGLSRCGMTIRRRNACKG